MTRGPVDFSRSSVSRYVQLATLFRRRIQSGEWAVGSQIPTVDTLAAEHGVARATIRQALDSIQAEGLIERFRAKGTFVTQQPSQKLWCEVPTTWNGLLLSAPDVQIEILEITDSVLPRNVMHEFGTLAPTYRRWRRRHSWDGQRYYLGDAYIDTQVADRLPDDALTSRTALRILRDVKDLELTEVRQTITLGSADVEIS